MPEIDPSLYASSMEFELHFSLSGIFGAYSSALETMESYTRQTSPEAEAALMKELSEFDAYKRMAELLGEASTANLLGEDLLQSEVKRALSPFTEEEAAEAQQTVAESEAALANFAVGFAAASLEKAVEFFDSQAEAEEATWAGTWRKLHGLLSNRDDTALVDIANFFDNLARLHHADVYDPQAADRGMQATGDISATTFYEVFSNHLSRAIVKGTEDGWTGM